MTQLATARAAALPATLRSAAARPRRACVTISAVHSLTSAGQTEWKPLGRAKWQELLSCQSMDGETAACGAASTPPSPPPGPAAASGAGGEGGEARWIGEQLPDGSIMFWDLPSCCGHMHEQPDGTVLFNF